MATRRRYELKTRADRMEATRRRIVETTVEMHRTIGPGATQISEVARRAGVNRVTVYNHFPEERQLLAACSAHWRALHPNPAVENWLEIDDPGERLRTGLRELYAWYRETEPMTGNVLRDAAAIPALQAILDGGLLRYLDRVVETLVAPFAAHGRSSRRVNAAARAVIDFHLWRNLAPLGDADAADLAAGLVERAAG